MIFHYLWRFLRQHVLSGSNIAPMAQHIPFVFFFARAEDSRFYQVEAYYFLGSNRVTQ
jgi:hypothetical protein